MGLDNELLQMKYLVTFILALSCSTTRPLVTLPKNSLPDEPNVNRIENPLSVFTNDTDLKQFADSLAHKYLIIDGHVDLPYRLSIRNFRPTKEFIGIPANSKEGDFDYTRAKKGGLSAPFMSIYIPSSYQKGGARFKTDPGEDSDCR